MKSIINKFYMALALTALSAVSVSANNYFDKEEECLKVSDIQAIEGHFQQFQNFTNTNKAEVCRDEVGEKWFEVVRSTLAMQRLTVTDQLQRDENDDLTLRPVGDKDWWTYYTQRANQFVIEPSRCNANENIVAFVFPFFRGSINLCPRFFEMDPASQIEVLMHEVRHFDGHAHVTCTQGNEQGARGACDQQIKSGGSYAVSVQANVELSYVDQLNYGDRVLAEAGAIYSINNKFNSLPTVKSEDYIYASNKDGEVWRMPKGKVSQAELVTTLKDAAAIYGNGSQFTVFPLNTQADAFRTSKSFITRAKSIGAYANMYNASSQRERSEYGPISYYGVGAIVKSNELHTFCGTQATSMTAKEFNEGSIKALPILKNDKGEDHMFILSDSGEMFDFTCNDQNGRLSVVPTQKTFPTDVATAFAFDQKTAYIVTTSGSLMSYDLQNETYTSELSTDQNWISATPLKVYNVFDNDLK
ncbi:MAG: hypothetical protein CME63_04455 [Halobacteriovoraceae bacterium]|nr:hypothetical protein [Halobacteriovoraceae bacterium]